MKTKIISLITLIFIAVNGTAQLSAPATNSSNYNTAIGLRAGETSGLTIKHFLGQSAALEGIVGLWNHGFSATLLFERHAGMGAPGLNWYYGAGGHVAFNTGHTVHHWKNDRYSSYRTDELGLGIDGVVGMEYKIRPIPIALSLDVKPFLEFTTGGDIWMSIDPSLGVKFTF